MKIIKVLLILVCLLSVSVESRAQSDLMTDEQKAQLELATRIREYKAASRAEDTTISWRRGFTPTVNFSQVSLSNWSGGGENAMSFTGLFSGFLNYEKNKWSWYNNLDLGYGMSKIGDNSSWLKTEDKIIYVEKLSYKLSKHTKLSWFNDFRTQFAEGRKYYKSETTGADTSDFVSTFLAPAYWTSAVGIEYKPSDIFYLFYAPAAHKMTIVNDPYLSSIGAYGIAPGNTFRSEFGTMLNAKLKFSVMENIIFTSGFTAFGNYETLDRIDMFWDNSLLMKVNKFVTVSFTANMIYDDDIKIKRGDGTIGPDLQYKHVLSVGVSAVIGDKP